MFENKIVYLDRITSNQKEFNEMICSDPPLEFINQQVADNYVGELECSFITILSPLFPNSLKLEANPPWVLYYQGNTELLSYDSIGIYGCELPSKMGLKIISEIMRNFDVSKTLVTETRNGICNQAIMSGLAHQKHAIVLVDSTEELINGGYFINKIKKNNIVVTPNIDQFHPKHCLNTFVFKMASETIEINLGEFDQTLANKNF
jgi:predicted Rossmann fold nucleotide-binding protein DprA/Smf involved in DNA uptake